MARGLSDILTVLHGPQLSPVYDGVLGLVLASSSSDNLHVLSSSVRGYDVLLSSGVRKRLAPLQTVVDCWLMHHPHLLLRRGRTRYFGL